MGRAEDALLATTKDVGFPSISDLEMFEKIAKLRNDIKAVVARPVTYTVASVEPATAILVS